MLFTEDQCLVQDTVELLWFTDAQREGIIKEGAKLPVLGFKKVVSGKGFIVICVAKDKAKKEHHVASFVWKNSPQGKILLEAFAGMQVLDTPPFLCQERDKKAILSTSDLERVNYCLTDDGLLWRDDTLVPPGI